jgi:hypothetical protein
MQKLASDAITAAMAATPVASLMLVIPRGLVGQHVIVDKKTRPS